MAFRKELRRILKFGLEALPRPPSPIPIKRIVFDTRPHPRGPVLADLGDFPNVILRAFDTRTEVRIQPMRRNAEPMIGIEEREPPLQHVVDLDADLAGRRSEVAPPAYIFAVTVERLEEHRIGQTYDQEPVEVRVARRIFQQGQSACAVDGQLDRANSRERLETVEVRVEQYSRVADNRDLLVLGADALLDPGDFAV